MRTPAAARDLIEPLADFSCTFPDEALPPEVLAATATLVLDALAVGLVGTLGEGVPGLLATLRAAGGPGPGRLLGRPERLLAGDAAAANAALIHALEFDPVSDAWLVHPLAGSLPAALAVADERGDVGGRELLAAVALGTELACRIACAATAAPRFYRPGPLATFAAVATAARLLRLGPALTRQAFGIAYSQDGGTPYQAHEEGTAIHAALPGFGVRTALLAVRLARAGLTGPRRVLEGDSGYYQLYEQGEWERGRALAGLGEIWLLRQVSLKPFPSGRLTHGAIDGLLELRRQEGVEAAEVTRLQVRASQHVVTRTGRRPGPGAGPVDQRLSVPFTAAQALLRGRVGLREFGPGLADNPAVQALIARTELEVAAEIPSRALTPLALRLELRDGRAIERRVDHLLGSPERPLSAEQRRAKILDCWETAGRPTWWSPERLAAAVAGLERAPDLAALWAVLRPT